MTGFSLLMKCTKHECKVKLKSVAEELAHERYLFAKRHQVRKKSSLVKRQESKENVGHKKEELRGQS